jgi:hypothetical protein
MLKQTLLIGCLAAIFAVGCAGSSKKINHLAIGMTKAEVIEIMGDPSYTSGAGDVEILSYHLTNNSLFTDPYDVRLKQGKVERFGRQGGYGSFY